MINLVGCNKENFSKLLKLMQYLPKKDKNKEEEFFVYKPRFSKTGLKKGKEVSKNNPFSKLTELRFR